MSNNFHKSLADKFNRKKTIQNDISRISNIHKKTNTFIPVLKNTSTNIDITEPIKSAEPFYLFDKLKTSTTLNLDTSRENGIIKIPKISFKEIIVPSYSPNDNFDLNKLNQNISTPIHMDIFASDIINDGDVNRLKKRHVRKFYHIYQEKYANDSNPTGFGDFIRSCFFIVQFCTKYAFDYEIIINHPIADFLQNHASNYSNKNISSILNNYVYIFSDTNWIESIFDKQNNIEQFILSKQKYNLFIDYLCSLPVINNSIFSYNIFFPIDNISLELIDKIKFIFEPSREIIEYIDETLIKLDLFKNKFLVLHIRSGDSYLKGENKLFNSLYFEIIKNEIIEIMFNKTKDGDSKFLLIADNNEIKYLLRDEFPHFKLYFKDITHLGEGVELEREKVKNTLLDFYLMSYATNIYSFTSYPHGSGFSYWCSKLYNIPYNCKYIHIK
jgi:hypothetical protein